VKKKVFVLIMVLATVLVFGSGTAMADGDAILFPYWVSGGGYATFV
jgi:ABC-type glycerol-3-phosphate transport system substrate-binding protein